MRTRATIWPAVALLISLGLGGTCRGQLQFEKTTVNVAPTGSDTLVADFPFKVGGTETVVIGEVKADCSCSAGTLAKRAYQAGEEGSVQFEFRVGDYSGPQEKRLYVVASDQKQPHVLTLLTDLPKVYDISPRSVYWDHAAPLKEKIITFEVAAAQTSVTTLEAASDHPAMSVSVKEIVPGRKFELHLTPSATTEVLVAKIHLAASFANKTQREYNCFAMVKPRPE